MEQIRTPSRPYGILVVDDEGDVPELFRQLLRRDVRRGRYDLYFADSGVEALDFLNGGADKVDLLITDINMPNMDGLTLLQHVADADFDLHAVVLSAYGDMKNIRKAMNRGAFDFVVKPVDFDDLQATMERSLTNLEAWREAQSSRQELQVLNRDLEIAWRVQNSVLPKVFPAPAGCDVHASLEPARHISGDFYDVIRLDENRIGLVVADVSGKGISAAMLMMSVRTMVRGLAIGLPDPGRVLAEANDLLCQDNELANFVTMFFGIFDGESGVLSYALAGHDAPVLLGSEREAPAAGGPVLGLLAGETYPVHALPLSVGEGVCVFTDGVTEAQAASGGFYGRDRLEQLLSVPGDTRVADAAGQVERVVGAVHDFVDGHTQADDITCLALVRRKTG